MPKYIHTVKKLGDLSSRNIRKTECSDEAEVWKILAYCYKQLNKSTRDDCEHIIKGDNWIAFDGLGKEILRFKFHVRYDSDNEYLHIYEFSKCDLY